jgi:nucleotidyltransferase substrate binding protein (TIGR01987 family)
MHYSKEKIKLLAKALKSLEVVLTEPYSNIVRDATIQRFEFTFELLWKSVKIFLREEKNINCDYPKNCFRELRGVLGLSERDIETCLEMCDSRNVSVHLYSENMARALFLRIKKYFEVSKLIYELLKKY